MFPIWFRMAVIGLLTSLLTWAVINDIKSDNYEGVAIELALIALISSALGFKMGKDDQ